MSRRIAIVGAGMAGASMAAFLGGRDRVILLEGEEQPGFHATGRSAAFWSEIYGGPGVQPLTTASGPFLRAPPPGYGDGFLRTRGELVIARDRAPLDRLEAEFTGSEVRLERRDPRAVLPALRGTWDALWLPTTADIDVARLHAAFLAAARRAGAALRTRAHLRAMSRRSGVWQLDLDDGTRLEADVLVNAAGAWADEVAAMAGAAPVGIRPFRRTVVQLRIDPPAHPDLPLVIDAGGEFYFKPEAGGRVWLSPLDETPAPAGDAAAEEGDVALAIHRLERAVDWQVAAVERRWAGLRSFAPDRLPVYGWDRDVPGFFWCAGQGGFGIQTAPAAGRLCAALLGEGAVPDGVDPACYRPDRF